MIPFLRTLGPTGAALLLTLNAHAADLDDYEPDLEIGEEINQVCAGCHGEFAQGTKDGEYPRLAGQPAGYLERQLILFRERKRPNIPMLEHIQERQMPASEVKDISAYIASIELPTTMPAIDESSYDPLERLLLAKKTINIPRADGDIEAGRKQYRMECASCHGREGQGDEKYNIPMLSGQYTVYLWRQVEKFRKGILIHDPDDPEFRLLSLFTDEEIRDMFAWLSVADD